MNFKVYQLVKVWRVDEVSINSSSLDEVIQSVLEENLDKLEYISTDFLYETLQEIPPTKNNNFPTLEIRDGTDTVIYTNVDRCD